MFGIYYLVTSEDEDVAFIIVDEFFSWNSHPDDSKSVIQNNIMLKQFDEQVVYNQVDILHFSGKLVKTTNNDMPSLWSENSQIEATSQLEYGAISLFLQNFLLQQ